MLVRGQTCVGACEFAILDHFPVYNNDGFNLLRVSPVCHWFVIRLGVFF